MEIFWSLTVALPSGTFDCSDVGCGGGWMKPGIFCIGPGAVSCQRRGNPGALLGIWRRRAPRYDGLWIYLQPFPARSCSSASSYTARTAGADYLIIHEKCCVFSISLSFVLRGNGKRMHPKAWRRRDRELNSLCLFFFCLVCWPKRKHLFFFFCEWSASKPNKFSLGRFFELCLLRDVWCRDSWGSALLCSCCTHCWSYGYHIY